MFESFSIIFTIATLFNFINYKWLKLPTTIGLMILSLILIIPITLSKTIFPSYRLLIILNIIIIVLALIVFFIFREKLEFIDDYWQNIYLFFDNLVPVQ